MGQTTSKWGLWSPTAGDSVRPASNDYSLMQSTVDTALTKVANAATAYTDSSNAASVAGIGRTVTSFRASSFVQKGYTVDGSVRIVVMGDSKAEGAGAHSEQQRWQGVLRDSLRDRLFGADGDQGIGYIPAQYTRGSSISTNPTITGTAGTDYDWVTTSGLGMRAVLLKTTAATVTFPTTKARYVNVNWPTGGGLTGSFEVWINGVKKGTFSCSTGASSMSVAGSTFDLGSVQDAQLKIVCTAGNAQVEGAAFTTSSKGLSLYDASHSGWRADLYDTAPGSDMNLSRMANYNPHLVIVALGGTDMSGNFGTPIPASAWATSLTSLYGKIRDRCPNAGILFLHGAMRCEDAASATSTDYPAKLGEFETAARNAVGNLEKASLLYESTLWQPLQVKPKDASHPTEQDPSGWLYDSFNPSDYGHSVIGGFLVNQIAQAIPAKVWDGGTL